ncbi:MAG: N-acetylmuramoyl-L-alanine amidase [Nitrospirae bacterium]|nr:N-acetylmuramoyl-L-alanine amidase [Nitrospirota bacterium]
MAKRPFIKAIQLCALFMLLSVLPPVPVAAAENTVEVKELRVGVNGGGTRIVLEFNRLPSYSAHRLKNPERVYFDLKRARLSPRIVPVQSPQRGLVKEIRISQYNEDTVRVVLELDQLKDYKTFTLESPPRLVVDIGQERNPFYRERKIVVIDPGHGGHDPGATGPRGLKEKDVTLDTARKLKKILQERYNLDVYLTRNSDVYIGLDARTAIANKKRADLFVSIHTNASRRRRAGGIETYLLNWTNDTEAMRVAARENAISMEKMKRARSELGTILASLERETKRDESLRLAHFIQNSLYKRLTSSYRGIGNLGVKQALFYVLVDAEMPSVLVEVAFISNPREERLLRSSKFRSTAAEAIASGIYRYIMSLPDAPKLAMK